MTQFKIRIKTGLLLFSSRTLTIVSLLLTLLSCNDKVTPAEILKEKPSLYPDYVGVTIPTTIAPLNFKVKEDYTAIDAVIEGRNSKVIHNKIQVICICNPFEIFYIIGMQVNIEITYIYLMMSDYTATFR